MTLISIAKPTLLRCEEQSSDSLTGYFDFEGYRLYRSTDGGKTWGGPDDRLYDFNGKLVGWLPYAQFDFSYQTDFNHCIYLRDCW